MSPHKSISYKEPTVSPRLEDIVVKEDESQAGSDMQSRSYKDLSQRDKRSLIFHYLYAMDSYDYQVSLNAVVDTFNRGFDLDVPLDADVLDVAQQVVDARDELDEKIKPLLTNWRFDRLGCCTRLILRYALWELSSTDMAPSVVINEAIELAKCFAERDAYKFINGLLDEAVKQMGRSDELEKTADE